MYSESVNPSFDERKSGWVVAYIRRIYVIYTYILMVYGNVIWNMSAIN